ncbi:MAG: hypothetical protein DCF29_24865 [Alphaproteobacteria bacterium]|nr:MAG: hypothetical protein DCF29_24865 [Alphaproteobacteria bacterium]
MFIGPAASELHVVALTLGAGSDQNFPSGKASTPATLLIGCDDNLIHLEAFNLRPRTYNLVDVREFFKASIGILCGN